MATQSHIVSSYEAELADLDAKISHMGGMTEQLLANGFDALIKRDPALAERVISSDRMVDEYNREIEEKSILVIAKRQPMAVDLRQIMAAMRVASDLERIGDLAKNIAKRALAVASEQHPRSLMAGLGHMVELALRQLKDVLDAYAHRDADKALTVWRSDAQIDAMYNSVFRELLTYMMEDPRNIGLCTHLLFGAKNIERIGDHTTNIAETVHYLVKGMPLTDERPKSDHHEHDRDRAGLISIDHLGGFRMVAKVLIVEDEDVLVELLRYNFQSEGFSVVSVARGDEVEMTVAEETPDLIILDWMLPGASGIEVCRRLRANAATRGVPIIMLTARVEEGDRVRGLTTGADDYVTKPFSVPELMARAKALIRRAHPERIEDVIEVGEFRFDRVAYRVTRNTREVRLGPTEYRLLEYFLERAGRVLTREQLLDGVWGRSSAIDERTVDVHIGRLRRALIRGREADPIRTVRGIGYVFGKEAGAAAEADADEAGSH